MQEHEWRMNILHGDRVMGRARLVVCGAIDIRYHDRALNPIKLKPFLITNDLSLKHQHCRGLNLRPVESPLLLG
jgi:hypothetical protein